MAQVSESLEEAGEIETATAQPLRGTDTDGPGTAVTLLLHG
jgi:hypothetical protein